MKKRILIIGGTRNMGYYLSQRLAEAGADLTLLNRGITPDDLPRSIHRLHVDRTNHRQMRRALLAKSFDVIVDFVLFSAPEAQTIIDLFRDDTDHFIALSSGQVYLVREGAQRPYHEDDYAGRVMPAPKQSSYAYEEWRYGVNKREVEDRLLDAWQTSKFPSTILRLPMVNSARDPYNRLYNYYLRLRDGGPILVPATPRHVLNHVYAQDVVDAIVHLIDTGGGKGRAYNIAQDEHLSHEEFLSLLAAIMDAEAQSVYIKRNELVANGFLPDSAPFSERWMSALENTRSKSELGISYTPVAEYLETLVAHYDGHYLPAPPSYRRRYAEAQFARRQMLQSEH